MDNRVSIREQSSLESGTFNSANQLTAEAGGGKVRITGSVNKAGASVTVAGKAAAVHPQGGFNPERPNPETSTERDFPLGERCKNGKDSHMGNAGDWDLSKTLARAILRDRGQRRKWLARCLLLTIAWMAVGLWVVGGWLAEDAWKFLVWWGICFLLATVLVIFALYDALAVIREERENRAARLLKTVRDKNNTTDES